MKVQQDTEIVLEGFSRSIQLCLEKLEISPSRPPEGGGGGEGTRAEGLRRHHFSNFEGTQIRRRMREKPRFKWKTKI